MPREITNEVLYTQMQEARDEHAASRVILTRLDERSQQHEKRIAGVERRSAVISALAGFCAAIGVQIGNYFGIHIGPGSG